jgi:hypothetical protein
MSLDFIIQSPTDFGDVRTSMEKVLKVYSFLRKNVSS